ncbi:MAG: ABC transporter ATP-binding protein [Bifidobacteriaceae bacterium]|jgi:ABC-2 type transport system ATP-binding protein|nr:ABC transporter ATP-binding protein [Bifidobacteriaceae bacterium]
MTNAAVAISVRHVAKSFGETQVLTDVSFDIAQGEVFTLLGENGAGKTTLISILSTLTAPDSGQVSVGGFDVSREPDSVREIISLNSQSTTLDEEFSGYDNLALIARLHGVRKPEADIERLSARLNLSDFLKRKVSTYSGGMRRRLDVAMSLIGNPSIIMLDEPTTGVDPRNRLEIWDIIREIRDSGITVLLTTQYLDEADKLSDHIAFLHEGRIALYGTPEEVKATSRQDYNVRIGQNDVTHARQALNDASISVEDVEPVESDLETVFFAVTEKEDKKKQEVSQ